MDFYGKRIATASSDRTVRVFDVAPTGERVQTGVCTGHEGAVWQCAWAHPQFGSLLATCGYDRRVLVFRESAGAGAGAPAAWVRVLAFEGHASSVNSVAWAPHEYGLHLACASSDGRVSVLSHRDDDAWDVATLADCPLGANAVAWAPYAASAPARRLAVAGCDGAVRVHAAPAAAGDRWALGATLARAGASREWLRDVAWCPAGAAGAGAGAADALLLAAASDDGSVSVWRAPARGAAAPAAEWAVTALPPFPAPVWRVSWSATGRLLAVSCADNSVTVWKEELSGATWQREAAAAGGKGGSARAGARARAKLTVPRAPTPPARPPAQRSRLFPSPREL